MNGYFDDKMKEIMKIHPACGPLKSINYKLHVWTDGVYVYKLCRPGELEIETSVEIMSDPYFHGRVPKLIKAYHKENLLVMELIPGKTMYEIHKGDVDDIELMDTVKIMGPEVWEWLQNSKYETAYMDLNGENIILDDRDGKWKFIDFDGWMKK